MGSLCCVAARPHEPHASRRQWSIRPRESYWQMHTTFSPPLSRKWEYILPRELLSHDGGRLDDSDQSSNIEESRSWVRDGSFRGDPFSSSDGSFSGLDSSFGSSLEHTSIVPPLELTGNELPSTASRETIFRPLVSMFSCEGSSTRHCDRGPLSPTSDAGMSQNEGAFWSSDSSMDLTDFTGNILPERSIIQCGVHDNLKCELCTKCLSDRSPWSSWRIMKNGNMPIAAILSCHHVFHVECLEQIVPKTEQNDPPCPLCTRAENENMSNQKLASKFKNVFPWISMIKKEGTPNYMELQNGWVRL